MREQIYLKEEGRKGKRERGKGTGLASLSQVRSNQVNK